VQLSLLGIMSQESALAFNDMLAGGPSGIDDIVSNMGLQAALRLALARVQSILVTAKADSQS
jgi:hypothetical protein